MRSQLLNCIAMTGKQFPAAKSLCDNVAGQIGELDEVPSGSAYTATDGTITVTAGIDSVGSAYCGVTGVEG